MTAGFRRVILVILFLANAGAVLLYCGGGPWGPAAPGTSGGWNPILALVARVTTLPIPTGSEIAAVRDGWLLICLGLLLIVVAFVPRTAAPTALNAEESKQPGRFPWLRNNPATRWLLITGAATILIAILSAAQNDTWQLSAGWVIRIFAGIAWAFLISHFFTLLMARQALFGLLIIGIACLILTLAHRADRHVTLFTWPIGPITPTAAFAALWSAMAIAFLMGLILLESRRLSRDNLAWLALVVVVLCLGAYVLQQTVRRSPMLGLVGAIFFAIWLFLRERLSAKLRRVIAIGLPLVVLVGAGAYLARQWTSANREVSGSVGIRFEYWRVGSRMILANPSLGFGPDTFFIHMTNAIAPLRDVSPHFYHGNIDNYAHNEWIQAAIETGIPGGVFYLLIPVGVLFIAMGYMPLRRLAPAEIVEISDELDLRAIAPKTIATRMALAAGLVAILITEFASVTLRTAQMPVWYWTLIGLLAAACREPVSESSVTPAAISRLAWFKRILCLLLAAGCFFSAGLDLKNVVSAAIQPIVTESDYHFRLYAEKSVMHRWSNAVDLADHVRGGGRDSNIDLAVKEWQTLFYLLPGFRDTPARYAEMLMLAGQPAQARLVVEEVINNNFTPHEVAANQLLALLSPNEPELQLRCLERGIRNAALRPAYQQLLKDITNKPGVQDLLQKDVDQGRGRSVSRDDVTLEALRLIAFLNFDSTASTSQPAGDHNRSLAIADQQLAAEWYKGLEQSNDAYRRGHEAEIDAWYTYARMLIKGRPESYRQAFDAIRIAERYAVLSIAHQRVANPSPQYGYVIGEVMPTEFPEELRPLWDLSALLHIIAGVDEYIDFRIYFSLPPEQWTEARMHARLAELTQKAYEILSKLPADKRPAHYANLARLVQQQSGPSPVSAVIPPVPRATSQPIP